MRRLSVLETAAGGRPIPASPVVTVKPKLAGNRMAQLAALSVCLLAPGVLLAAFRPLEQVGASARAAAHSGTPAPDSATQQEVARLCSQAIGREASVMDISDRIADTAAHHVSYQERSIVCASGGERYLLRVDLATGALYAISHFSGELPHGDASDLRPPVARRIAVDAGRQALIRAGVAPDSVTLTGVQLDPPSRSSRCLWKLSYVPRAAIHSTGFTITILLDGATGQLESYRNLDGIR